MAAQPETDEDFRLRVLRVADERDWRYIRVALTHQLDAFGRKYGRFRYGTPLAEPKDPPHSEPGE